ncbi:MAG: hypothetical protein VB144_11980, partial [Clostridia bacterium]|nr:hypothetical protein [Clostridia bacterium]
EVAFAAVTIDTTPPAIPGIPTTASPTRNTSPVWVWVSSGADAVSYNVYLDDGFIANVEVPTYTTVGLAEGAHHLQVTAIDALGNESDVSATGHVVIDLTGPVAPHAPKADENPTIKPTQHWQWDYVEDAKTFQMQISADGETWGDLIDVGNAATYVTEFTGNGVTRYLRVRATDALGNAGNWSVAGSVFVDTVAPASPAGLDLTEPAGTLIDGILYTTDGTPKVKWNSVVDAVGYTVEIDGQGWMSTTGTSYEFTEGLADGVHTVRVKAGDGLGNWSTYSGSLTFTVDTTAPAVPDVPTTASPTNALRTIWAWTAVDGAAKYRVYEDKSDKGFVTDLSYQSTNLTEGTHYLQITAIDTLGNESARSAAGSVLVDRTAPPVPEMSPLPTHTSENRVTFSWSSVGDVVGYDFTCSTVGEANWTEPERIAVQSKTVDISEVGDGRSVRGRVRAYDALGNVSEWSEEVSTTVDRTGPSVSVTTPTQQVSTNIATFTWKWSGTDDGAGVQGYWVRLNGGAWSWTTESSYTCKSLRLADNVLVVKGVDGIGNESAETVAPSVNLVNVMIYDAMPAPGEHPINEVSTIAFSVVGLYDAPVEVLMGAEPLEHDWRIVTITNTPAIAKFYILLDDAVMEPGPMTITVKIGEITRSFDYQVLSERSGFGFGRLRPW